MKKAAQLTFDRLLLGARPLWGGHSDAVYGRPMRSPLVHKTIDFGLQIRRQTDLFQKSLIHANHLGRVLRNAPQDPGRIKENEVFHFPRPLLGRFCAHAVLLFNSFALNVFPPRVYVFH